MALTDTKILGAEFSYPLKVTRGYYVPKIAFKYKLSKVPIPSRGDWGF